MFSVRKSVLRSVSMKFRSQGGETRVIAAVVGDSIMRNARTHRVELESACDGSCTCSTCMVHLSREVFDTLPPPSEAECDMLDTAPSRIHDQSRLSCQVIVTGEMENVCVDIPDPE